MYAKLHSLLAVLPVLAREPRGFRIHSHLTGRERAKLYELASRDGVKVALEIGSYVGASAYFLAAGLRRSGGRGKVICVDTWNNDAMTEGAQDTWRQFSRNVSKFSDLIVPVRGFSGEVVEQVAREADRVDLLFIDGDHSYDGAKADWDAYEGLLSAGACVVFHDWGWAEGVQRVVAEDVLPLCSHHGHLPNLWWGILGARRGA